MLSNIGPGMIIVIIVVALLLFGPSKLPELGRAFGKTLREFKNGARDAMGGEEDDKSAPPARKEVGPDAQGKSDEQNEKKDEKKDESRRLPD